MAIIIQNVSKKYGHGLQHYQLLINRKVIANFTHIYKDGLASCLHAAARAASDPQRQENLDDWALIEALVNHK